MCLKAFLICEKFPAGGGGGYVGTGIVILIAAPDLVQAAQVGSVGGLADQSGDMLRETYRDTVIAATVGTTVITGTSAVGGTLTIGGTVVVSGGTVTAGSVAGLATTATGIGGLVTLAGGTGYMAGNQIGKVKVGGQSIHTWIGEGMYKVGSFVTNWW